MAGYEEVAAKLAGWTGTIGGFTRMLDAEAIAYLSFSKITTMDFCPYAYYLEYIKKIVVRPQPDYFIKGHLFHEAAARAYRAMRRGREVDAAGLKRFITSRARSEHHDHLHNAVSLAIDNAHIGWEVVGIEQPFVLSLGPSLPPCLGVVDLILRKQGQYAVVDHKTGKNFNGPDDTQLAIYGEHVNRTFGVQECTGIFDEYRWVNNLTRIRKPGFSRTVVKPRASSWKKAERRLAKCHRQILSIERKGDAAKTGNCFMCRFGDRCPYKTTPTYESYGYRWW